MRGAIIFDFDGTIADSMVLMVEAYNYAAELHGLNQLSTKDVDRLRLMHLRDILYLLKIPYLKVPLVLYSALNYYKVHVASVKLFEGVAQMLCSLKVLGYDLYIVSTNNTETIRAFLGEHDLNFFNGIYSCGSSMFGKDTVIESLIKKEMIVPAEAFYVGDEMRDIDAARRVGLQAVAVGWGYNRRSVLLKQRPDILVDEPEELVSFFSRNGAKKDDRSSKLRSSRS